MKMENKYYTNIVKKLKKLRPSLILSCKIVPMTIKEYLLQKNISLVCRIDGRIIEKIAELTEG